MKTILLTNKYTGAPLEIVKNAVGNDFSLEILSEVSGEELKKKIPEADYLLVSGRLKIGKDVLERAQNLKMIQRTGVGLDSLDLDAIDSRKIPLYVNQGVNAESVAEHALLLILSCLRRLVIADTNTKNGVWNKQSFGVTTHELYGKTVGLIGMGNIAKRLATLLKGFNVNIVYYDLYRLSKKEEADLNARYADLDELLKEAEIISLHCPLTEKTRHIIDEKSIDKMRNGVVIVNTARGGLIAVNALIAALNSGKVSFAGLDVHEEEPLSTGSAILRQQNVILTPHIGGVTFDSFSQMMEEAIRNIRLFDQGRYDEIEQYRYKR